MPSDLHERPLADEHGASLAWKERHELIQEFLRAVREVTKWQYQQTQAIIDGDPDFERFDVLIRLASERKEQCKYAIMAHVEASAC